MKKCFIIALLIMVCMSLGLSAETVWKDDFDSIKDWYDNDQDQTFQAVIVSGNDKGTALLKQEGKDTWGKVACVLSDINVSKFNTLRVKVDQLSKNADYKILVGEKDWSRTYEVISAGNDKGISECNIQSATGWEGKKTFVVILVVEGKNETVLFDWIELISVDKKK